jgi:hypothetical protein
MGMPVDAAIASRRRAGILPAMRTLAALALITACFALAACGDERKPSDAELQREHNAAAAAANSSFKEAPK